MLGNTETEGASHHYVNNVIEIPRFKQKNYVSGKTKSLRYMRIRKNNQAVYIFLYSNIQSQESHKSNTENVFNKRK